VPFRHRYSVGQILRFIQRVLSAAISLRGASQAIDLFRHVLPVPLPLASCSWTTGRVWLLRLGDYKLIRPKEQAHDWVWIVDHSVQLGAEKCLLILGLRLSNLPPSGTSVCHADVDAIELLPVTKSNGAIVWQQLEQAAKKTGIPREIISDHGSDVRVGIRTFCEHHPETCSIYAITHRAANVLTHTLEQDEAWQQFTSLAAQSKSQIQQTALAYLRAPKQQRKARYMNIEKLVTWGWKLLMLLDQRKEMLPVSAEECAQIDDKLGWIHTFREPLAEWHGLLQLIGTTEQVVREEGLHSKTPELLLERLGDIGVTERTREIRHELVTCVREESLKARPQERLLGSSEVIESVFGKLKRLERDQAHNGFTGLVLSAAALVSTTTIAVIHQAMERVSTQMVLDWCRETFGKSLQAKRKEAFAGILNEGIKMGST
jgi:hypothetical protein